MYREGRHVYKKYKKACNKNNETNDGFWVANRRILMKKLVAAAFTAKLESMAVVGPPFSMETTFFVN